RFSTISGRKPGADSAEIFPALCWITDADAGAGSLTVSRGRRSLGHPEITAAGRAMSDVDRLFKRLVEVLALRSGPGLQDPIELQDLYQKIIPYRLHRTALRFDSNQDYEMALLRLLAGENGYMEVEPADVAAALAREAHSINPNPGAFRAFGQARAKL